MLKRNVSMIDRLLQEEDGQNLIEYAMVAGILALGAVVALTAVHTQISTMFTWISYGLQWVVGN